MKRTVNNKGMTLVVLVVTVIILMILAGITLTLVLGQNGIINKAKEAKKMSANAQMTTGEGLNNLYNEIISETDGKTVPTTVAASIGEKLSDTDNIKIKDNNGNIITIPAGFKIASDSATSQDDGIVIEDNEGNQFVWVPVANISDYTRTDFGSSYDADAYSSYSEEMPSDEQTSVSTYHGYYIGRYEAGDSISTANKTLRESGTSTTNKVAIKKGQAPYNYITKEQSKTLAEQIKMIENYKATTKLCSSYAWDTAVNFMQNKVSNYGTSSPQGNYLDTTFDYTDITGAHVTKPLDTDVLIPTGQTTSINKIYDMGGNTWEWTTETCSGSTSVDRGGGCSHYNIKYNTNPAGYRDIGLTGYSEYNTGFRVTLYM